MESVAQVLIVYPSNNGAGYSITHEDITQAFVRIYDDVVDDWNVFQVKYARAKLGEQFYHNNGITFVRTG